MGGFIEVSPQGTVTVLADAAATAADFDRAALTEAFKACLA
jgi:F0F1-type ATP synthase epsilon subunit